jgi:hypothetical protein
VENEITAARVLLSQCRIEFFDIEGALDYARGFIRNLGACWYALFPQIQPWFHKLVFPEGIPYMRNCGYGTAKLGYIYTLNQHFDGQKSSLVDLVGINWNQIVEELKEWDGLKAVLSDRPTEESGFY